jgi:uncharacterized membrane protein
MRLRLQETIARSHLQDHIQLVARHEQDFLDRRTAGERIGDAVAGWMGKLWFVLLHSVIFASWIVINTVNFPWIRHFDPLPFQLLGVIFAFEAILLASFVLMRQSRIGRRSDERDHLELQVLLLTEKEITAVLTICRAIAEKMELEGVAKAPGVEEMSQDMQIDEVAETIRDNLTSDKM